ncbi:MAG TPA: hypothetical protein GX704_01010 [Clostridiales bacterium]|nr:hypothetical protein [Clostridiales bacterium]
MINRILSAKILSVLLVILLVSCGGPSGSPSGADTAADVTADAVIAETETDIYADLPKSDFGGYEFRILNNISNFAMTTMFAEELNGEPVNDAIYNRNALVEQDLNINMVEQMQEWHEVTATMQKLISAGDPVYDAFWNESKFQTPFAVEGKLIPIEQLTNIAIEKPWWYAKANDSLSIGGNKHILIGDLHLMFKESFWMTGFNKSVIDANSLADPYELVDSGKWTLDAMHELMAAVTADIDGDGKITADDMMGVSLHGGGGLPFMIGTGVRLSGKDDNDLPTINVTGEAFISRYSAAAEKIFGDKDLVCLEGRTANTNKYNNGFHGVFFTGHTLFYVEPIGSLKKLRDMDAEFGVVPFPKYDETQQEYSSLIASFSACMAVPVTNTDLDRTGIILENLCARSYEGLRQAYSEVTLDFKYIRDEESSKMLQLIFDTGAFELTSVFGWGGVADTVSDYLSKGNPNIASTIEKKMSKIESEMAKTVEALAG